MSCKVQPYSYLVRRLGEHCLLPEIWGQVTVGLGDGIEGSFCWGQDTKVTHHGDENSLAGTRPRSSTRVGFRRNRETRRGLSDIHTKLKFLSLSSYDNYTTSNKCNRADWEICLISMHV